MTPGDTPTDKNYKPLLDDACTEQILAEPPVQGGAFMKMMYHLHVDLYAGLLGKWFPGFMDLLLVALRVSQPLHFGDYD